MLALHKPATIFSFRHAPSWLLLTFAAGSVNAIAFLACQRFVTHVTGTASRLGMEIHRWWLAFDYALVLLSFIAGAVVAASLIDGRFHKGKRPLYATPLLIEVVLIATVGLLGHYGWFGPFGGTVDLPVDFVFLSILSFAMGLQNAAVATSTGLVVRTTHLTGPATDLGIHISTYFSTEGEARRAALRGAALRFGKIIFFIAGAIVSVPIVHRWGFLSLLMPALLISGAAALSFIPKWGGLKILEPTVHT